MISPATRASFSKWLSWPRDTTTPNSTSLGWRSSKGLYKFENAKAPQTTFTQLITRRVRHHWDVSRTGPLWARRPPGAMESLDVTTQHVAHSDNLKTRSFLLRQPVTATRLPRVSGPRHAAETGGVNRRGTNSQRPRQTTRSAIYRSLTFPSVLSHSGQLRCRCLYFRILLLPNLSVLCI